MKKLIPFLFSLSIAFIGYAVPGTPAEKKKRELQSLKVLYMSIKNDTILKWDIGKYNDTIPITWKGVTLNAEGYVSKLDLSGMQLEAQFLLYDHESQQETPNMYSLVYLSEVETIDLSGNNFSGDFPYLVKYTTWTIPDTVDKTGIHHTLSKLKYLDISGNSFSGLLDIPKECDSLQELRAANNNFFGVYPPATSTDLRIIDVSNNNLNGFSPFLNAGLECNIDTINASGNSLNFYSLWIFSRPEGHPDYLNYYPIYQDTNVIFLCDSQDSVYMLNDNPELVRSTPGNPLLISLPDVGQNSSSFPEIKDILSYQWFKDGMALEGDTLSNLYRESFTDLDTGIYVCEIRSKTERLNELVLVTESIVVKNDTNAPPELFVKEGELHQEFHKGHESKTITLGIKDDVSTESNYAKSRSIFEVFRYPEHLLFWGFPQSFEVKDTTSMWVGDDTVGIRYCDFEGACDSIYLTFHVYDDLYATTFDSISIDSAKQIKVFWNTDMYETKPEKPDGYYVIASINHSLIGMGTPIPVDSVYAEGLHTNHVNINLNEIIEQNQIASDYMLQLQVYSVNSKTKSIYPGTAGIFMPFEATEIKTLERTEENIELTWDLSNNPAAYGMTNYNIIYRSINDANYHKIKETLTESSYRDIDIQEDSAYCYKIVKRAMMFGFPRSQFVELPYLASEVKCVVDSTDTINIPPAGIENNENLPISIEKNINVYPNPAKNELIIERGNYIVKSVRIIDNKGNYIRHYLNLNDYPGNIVLDISTLVAGVYMVKIETFDGDCIKKIVKE